MQKGLEGFPDQERLPSPRLSWLCPCPLSGPMTTSEDLRLCKIDFLLCCLKLGGEVLHGFKFHSQLLLELVYPHLGLDLLGRKSAEPKRCLGQCFWWPEPQVLSAWVPESYAWPDRLPEPPSGADFLQASRACWSGSSGSGLWCSEAYLLQLLPKHRR